MLQFFGSPKLDIFRFLILFFFVVVVIERREREREGREREKRGRRERRKGEERRGGEKRKKRDQAFYPLSSICGIFLLSLAERV